MVTLVFVFERHKNTNMWRGASTHMWSCHVVMWCPFSLPCPCLVPCTWIWWWQPLIIWGKLYLLLKVKRVWCHCTTTTIRVAPSHFALAWDPPVGTPMYPFFFFLANSCHQHHHQVAMCLLPLILLWCQIHWHPPSPKSIIISRCISFMHLLYFIHACHVCMILTPER